MKNNEIKEENIDHTLDELLDLILKELDSENMNRTENLSEYKRNS